MKLISGLALFGFVGIIGCMNVPYHRQFTDYSCAQGSSEMVAHKYGPDVAAQFWINAQRCTSRVGTYSFDMVRAFHLSEMSTGPILRQQIPFFPFPDYVFQNGIKGRPYGLASFVYRSAQRTCWHEKLVAILNKGIPVILLMWYDFDPSEGQHYRVAVGSSANANANANANGEDGIVFYDPWDRDDVSDEPCMSGSLCAKQRRRQYNISALCRLWDLPEEKYDGNLPPFVAVIAVPWDIQSEYLVDANGNLIVKCLITYVCPDPFCDPKLPPGMLPFIAENATASITFAQDRFRLALSVKRNPETTVFIGQFFPGHSFYVEWAFEFVNLDDAMTPEQSLFCIDASGLINGTVPRIEGWHEGSFYPAYSYTDRIGNKHEFWY